MRTWRASLLLALAWLAVIVYGFPGMMSQDPIQQLDEARAGFYTDAHPPLMAWLWHFVDKVIPGPFGMFEIQTTLVVAGLYLLLRRLLGDPTRAALVTALLCVYPPILAPLGVIWKDCFMAGAMALGTAGLLSEQRRWRLWGLAAFVLASGVRYNAPGATFPLIVLLFQWSPGHWVRRYAISLAAWLGVTASAVGIGAAITDRPMHFWHSTLALMDSAGTLCHGPARTDDEIRPLVSGTGIRRDRDYYAGICAVYSEVDFEPLIHGDHALWSMPISGIEPAPAPQRDAIGHMFTELVTGAPGAYLAHRWSVFLHVIAWGDSPVSSPSFAHRIQWADKLRAMGLSTSYSKLQDRWQRRVQKVARTTPLFRPWVYLAIALLLLPFARRHRDVLAVLLSGLGLTATLFLLAPTPDYRYSHWLVISTLIAIVVLIVRRVSVRALA